MLHLMDTTWHTCREAFIAKDMELLVSKLGRIIQAYRLIYHLVPHMYALVAYALRHNEYYLESTCRRFQKLIQIAKKKSTVPKDTRKINFSIGQASKMTHGASKKYRMPNTLIEEIAIVKFIFQEDTIDLSTPIGHIVPQAHTFEEGANTCKRACGGWSINFSF